MEEHYIRQLSTVPAPKMMALAVKLKEYPDWRPEGVDNFRAFKSAFEEILAIRHGELEAVSLYYHHKCRKWEIKDSYDLELSYQLLRNTWAKIHFNAPAVIAIKRGIRRYRERPARHRVISGDHDGYIALIGLPKAQSKEDANTIFCAEHYIQSPNSPFDCTGRPFTSWYKLFQRNGSWWAYHSVSFDV